MTRHSQLVLVVVVLAGLLAGGAAIADSPDREISACVHDRTGAVRIAEGPCRRVETPLTWSQIGPEGPRGPAGPQSLDIVIRRASGTYTLPPGNPDGSQGPYVPCAEGEVAISGGVIGFGPNEARAELVGFGPPGSGNGWSFGWLNPGDEPITINPTVIALCVPGTRVRE